MWSPWEDVDPDMRRTYGGADAGVGATYAWDGNRQAGAGSMVISDETPTSVDIDLTFTRPFRASNRLEFVLTPGSTRGSAGAERAAGAATAVEWRMHGELNPLMRLVQLVRPMDRMVGPDFEKGLARLATALQRTDGSQDCQDCQDSQGSQGSGE